MSPSRPAEERLMLPGPAGQLEAILRPTPDETSPSGAVVLFHPHPLFGGTMENKTLYRLAREIPLRVNHAVLRFNFRGAGQSEGRYDAGIGEAQDARAALDWLAARYPGLPLIAVGYSFGAVVGLRPAVNDPRVDRIVALGLPLNLEWDPAFLAETQQPRLFVQGEHDEFGNARKLRDFAATLPGPLDLTIVPGTGHLFTGKEDQAVAAVVDYIRGRLSPD